MRDATKHRVENSLESIHPEMSEGGDDIVIDTLGQRGNNGSSLPHDMSAYVFLPGSRLSLWKIQVTA